MEGDDLGSVNCTMMVADSSSTDEKQNLSVIFVPENILLALSKYESNSDAGKEEGQLKNVVLSACQQCSDDKFGNRNAQSGIFDPGISTYFLASSQVFVVDQNKNGTGYSGVSEKDPLLPSRKKCADARESVGNQTTLRQIKPHPKKDSRSSSISECFISDGGKSTNDSDKCEDSASGGPRRFKCNVFNCNKLFKTQEELTTHTKKHAEQNMYQCQYPGCPWSFPTPYKLRRHAESHKQSKSFKCPFPGCDVFCSTSYNLKVHQNSHAKDRRLHCTKCNLTFNNKLKMVKHLRTVHNADPKFPCTVKGCNKKFHTSSARSKHLRAHENGKKIYVCGVEGCGKQFQRPAVFREHFMTHHSGARPFKCDYPDCSWEFTTNSKLKRHQLTHTNHKSYQCPFESCKAQFYRREHLRSHLRVHTPESKSSKKGSSDPGTPIELNEDNLFYYFCPYEDCGSLFPTLVGAKQHIQKMHSVTLNQSAADPSPSKTENQPKIKDRIEEGSHSDMPIELVVCNGDTNHERTSTNFSKEHETAATSILGSLMQTETNIGNTSNEKLPTFSSSSMTSLNFATTSRGAVSCMETLNIPSVSILNSQTTSPTTTIDPSHFLLGTSEDLSPTLSDVSLRESEALGYINLQQPIYPTPSSATFSLPLSDCVPTVDPNVVMSIPSSIPVFRPTSSSMSSSCETSDEEDNPGPDVNNNNSHCGSARTDYNAYRKTLFDKKRKHTRGEGGNTGAGTSKKIPVDFDSAIASFNFNEGVSVQCGQFDSPVEKMSPRSREDFKNTSPPRSFTESTINLSDLA